MHGGGIMDFFKSSTTTPAQTVSNPVADKKAASESTKAAPEQKTESQKIPDQSATITKPEAPEPQMTLKQRMAGFTTATNAAYVLNRMEDKLDFLMQKEGLDDERKKIDTYWNRFQKGYFDKKQKQ
jgi:hypothetical protein